MTIIIVQFTLPATEFQKNLFDKKFQNVESRYSDFRVELTRLTGEFQYLNTP